MGKLCYNLPMNANEYRDLRRAEAKTPARICPNCGREHHKRTILCAKCYRSAPKHVLAPDAASLRAGVDPSQSKVCPVCGKTFYKKRSTSRTDWETQTKYCSRACYGQSKMLDLCVCEQCGAEFTPKGQSASSARFCSRSCWSLAQRTPLPLCKMCGETCHKHSARFCSPGCKKIWYRGPNVYNYLGGQGRNHYASTDWLEHAAFVRARDKICQHCGAETSEFGKVLHVHHIVPWRISFDDSLENLTTLCNACHKTEDHRLLQVYKEST